MQKLFLNGLLVAVLAFFAASVSYAQGKGYGKSFVERMGIDEKQTEELAGIKETRRANRKAENEVYGKLNLLVNSADYDAAVVEKLAQQLADLVKAHAIAEAALVNAFFIQLDETQQQQWEEHETRNNKRLKGARKQRKEKQAQPAEEKSVDEN